MINFQISGLAHIGIPTDDLENSLTFYQQLGFTLGECKVVDDTKIAFVHAGNVTIEFYQQFGNQSRKTAGAVDHFALQIDNMPQLLADLARLQIPLLVPLTTAPFGINGVEYVLIEGPNKEKIEFDHIL